MVRDVNATTVDPEEVLSNSAYLIDKNGFTKVPDPEQELPHFHGHSFEQLLDPIQDMDNDLEP